MALPSAFTFAGAVEEAWERCSLKLLDLGAEQLASLRRSTRLLLDDWNTDGVLFWKLAYEQTHTTAVGEASFALPTGTIDITTAVLKRDLVVSPMASLSADEWLAIPDKDQASGFPRRYFVQRENTDTPLFKYYPKADNATDQIVYDALMYFNQSTALDQPADVPRRWNEAFVSGMTAKVAEKFAPIRLAEKLALYGGPGIMETQWQGVRMVPAYRRARMGDRERGDTVFGVSRYR